MREKCWIGPVPEADDFGQKIVDVFVDGKTVYGPWATMTPASWLHRGIGRLGQGLGQRYQKQTDGRWLKVEG